MLVVLGDPHRDLRDLVLLEAVDHPQIRGVCQILAAVATTGREHPRRSCGSSVHARCDPGTPGCLSRVRAGPDRPRRGFSGGGGLPGPSSRDGGLEELPEFRDSRCSNRASFAARASLASITSDSCPAILAICRSRAAS